MKKSLYLGVAILLACVIFTSCGVPIYEGEGIITYDRRTLFSRYYNFYVLYPEFDLSEKGTYEYKFKGLTGKDPARISISTLKPSRMRKKYNEWSDIRIIMTLEDDRGLTLWQHNVLLGDCHVYSSRRIAENSALYDSFYPPSGDSTRFDSRRKVSYILKLEIIPNEDSEYNPLPVQILINSSWEYAGVLI